VVAPVTFVQPGRQAGRYVRVTILPEALPTPFVVNPIPPGPTGEPAQVHCRFSVARELGPSPGRATIELINLSEATRNLIATFARRPSNVRPTGLTTDGRVWVGTQVILEAGYLGTGAAALIRGQLLTVRSRHEGTEWITTLQVGDNEIAWTLAECRQSFDAGVTTDAVLAYAFGTMGMALAPPIPAGVTGYVLTRGFVAYGRSREVIDSILAGVAPDLASLPAIAQGISNVVALFDSFAGNAPMTRPITWWGEDRVAYLLERGRVLPGAPVRVSTQAEPGAVRLLERPERLEDGAVRVRMLLHGAVRVGRAIAIVSKALAGAYRVEAAGHDGGNRTERFETVAICRVVG
jgi:hypothetical protein